MYVCMYVCMYVRMYVCMYICINVCVCMYICIYVCMYVCMYICINICVCIYVYMYVRMYVCMYYVCMYICAGSDNGTHTQDAVDWAICVRGPQTLASLTITSRTTGRLPAGQLPNIPSACYWRRTSVVLRSLVKPLKPSGHYRYRQFNINKLYVLLTQCIYVFCVHLKTAIISLYSID